MNCPVPSVTLNKEGHHDYWQRKEVHTCEDISEDSHVHLFVHTTINVVCICVSLILVRKFDQNNSAYLWLLLVIVPFAMKVRIKEVIKVAFSEVLLVFFYIMKYLAKNTLLFVSKGLLTLLLLEQVVFPN